MCLSDAPQGDRADYCNHESTREFRKGNSSEPKCQETLLRLSEVVKQFITLLNIYK